MEEYRFQVDLVQLSLCSVMFNKVWSIVFISDLDLRGLMARLDIIYIPTTVPDSAIQNFQEI